MVKIRLARGGRKKRPFYRIVAADQRNAVTGGFLDVIGTYDPLSNPKKFEVTEEKLTYWMDSGAQPTDTVASLLKKFKKAE
ncbi:MAG: 30S ribosomal protein S16 [Fibrobacterota bacterium]